VIEFKDDRALSARLVGHSAIPTSGPLDERGTVAVDWGVTAAPETFLIGRDGKVLYKFISPLNAQVWRTDFLPLIREQCGDDTALCPFLASRWRVRLAALAFAALVTFGVAAAELEATFDDPALNERYWGSSASPLSEVPQREHRGPAAPVAADLRREVHRLVSEGRAMPRSRISSSRYGDFVLYRPRIAPVTYALWGGLLVFLVIGSVGFGACCKGRTQPLDPTRMPRRDGF
jgi:hypothetical protein